MRTGQDLERSVVDGRGVEMNPEREHLLQDLHRRLCVPDTRAKPRRRVARRNRVNWLDRDEQVLVPGEGPALG